MKSPSQYGEYNFLKIQNKFKKFFLLWQDIAERKKFKLKFSYKKNLITNLVCISTIFTNKDLTRDRVHLSNQSQLTSMNDWQTKNRQTYFQKKKKLKKPSKNCSIVVLLTCYGNLCTLVENSLNSEKVFSMATHSKSSFYLCLTNNECVNGSRVKIIHKRYL